MSSEKKHRRAEADGEDAPRSKKIKTDSASGETSADADALKAEEKRLKKEKKEKEKEKKERKEEKKRSKKEKKERGEKKREQEGDPEAATAGTTESSPVEEAESKPKKQKKSKESKEASQAEQTDSGDFSSGAGPYTYKQTAALSAVPESEVQNFLSAENISISDPRSTTNALRPILKFTHLPSSDLIAKGPFASFTTPTPIQAASWPHALSGRDVIGIAETGSGKTLAFSLPCVEALYASPPAEQQNGGWNQPAQARAVIVSPTRELAMQTHQAIAALAAHVGLSAVCVYGGAPKDEQRQQLLGRGKGKHSKGADIIVATPGRLKDFLSEGSASLSSARFVVLDEADRMLDKGFEDDIKEILGGCPPPEQRQTLMFTATWPTTVRALAESFMVDPIRITIGRHGAARATADSDGPGGNPSGTFELQANARISQKVEVVDPRSKEQRLLQILQQAQRGDGKDDRILVFCLYKKEATRVEQFLSRRGLKVAGIHGDLKQEQRTRSLEAFKTGSTTVLVATDVAARGLDIPDVKLVVNCTFPLTIEDYVHRIGRTGRAGKTGEAITLFTEHDKAHSGSLINILKSANQPVPDELFKFGTTVKKKAHDTYGAFFKDVDMSKKGTKVTFD